MAANRHGAGQPVQSLLGTRLETDDEVVDAGQTGGSFAGAGELARAIDAYERLGIDDLIVSLQPSTQQGLDRLARAMTIRGH